MENLILVVHLLVAVAIIGLILLQQGKGAEMGASFGAGASQTLFGSTGSGNFFSRLTAILATVFFVTSFTLAILAKQRTGSADDFSLPSALEVDTPAVNQAEESALNDVPLVDAISDEGEGSAADLPQVENSADAGDASDSADIPAVEEAEETQQ